MYTDFNGRRIVIAGGCGGIGRCLVEKLAQSGAQIIVLDLARSIEQYPLPAVTACIAFDASDPVSVTNAFAVVKTHFSGVDALVNLVGFSSERQWIENQSDASWHDVIDANLHAAFYIAREALPLLRHGEAATMVLMASGLAVKSTPGYGAYAVSKAGILAMTRLLAQEAAPHIRVNAVAPGAVDTDFLRGGTGRITAEKPASLRFDRDQYVQSVPLGRMAVADDITGPVLFFLSRASAYVTGQTLHVNGGMYMV